MFPNVNIAIGLAALVAAFVGGGVFIVTMFSFNATVIAAGFVLTGMLALGLFAILYRAISRMAPKDHGPVGTVVSGMAHALLLATNLVVVTFAAPSVVGSVLDPKLSRWVPVDGSTISAACGIGSVLSIGLLLERARRRK